LCAGIAGKERLNVEFCREFIPNLLLAAVMDLGIHLRCCQIKRDSREEIERFRFTSPEIFCAVIEIGGTVCNRVM